LALHFTVVGWVLRRPEPILVQPVEVMAGENGKAIGIVYLPVDAAATLSVNEQAHTFRYARPHKKRPATSHSKAPRTVDDQHPTEATVRAPNAGSRYGSVETGFAVGPDVLPALPVAFPDPHVSRAELPPGVAGDVVVEITIDEAGNVVKKKILQTIGYGIDEKVLATLENWRFRPATRFGMPIPSRQDVHFHFPG
jgi:TonB family protein